MSDNVLAKSILTCSFDPSSSLHADIEKLRMYNDDWLLADHYAECADMLLESMAGSREYTLGDRYIQPIFFLYRHALELDLKSLIREGEKDKVTSLSGKEHKAMKSKHELMWLWGIVRDRIWDKLGSEDQEQKQNIDDRLREIDKIDPWGQAFRYAKCRDGKDSLKDLPEYFDLGQLQSVVAAIRSYLQGSISYLIDMRRTGYKEDIDKQFPE